MTEILHDIEFRWIKWQNHNENTKFPISGPFFPKYEQNWLFGKN